MPNHQKKGIAAVLIKEATENTGGEGASASWLWFLWTKVGDIALERHKPITELWRIGCSRSVRKGRLQETHSRLGDGEVPWRCLKTRVGQIASYRDDGTHTVEH